MTDTAAAGHPAGLGFRYLGLLDDPPTRTEYHAAWDIQRDVHARVSSHQEANQVLFVEHDPVYTAGRRTAPEEYPFDGTPVVPTDRGGKITWHGPGQLVGYPIIFLNRMGVVDYVRRVEEGVIRYLATLGIASGRVPDRTGVWLAASDRKPERKICAIGVRVSHQTTLHGFALNVLNSTERFENIIPCGISDAGVTAIVDEVPAGDCPDLVTVARGLQPLLTRYLSEREPFTSSPDIERTVPAS